MPYNRLKIVNTIDTIIYYLLVIYALCSSVSLMGARNSLYLASGLAIVRYCLSPLKITVDKSLLKSLVVFMLSLFIASIFSYDQGASFKKISEIYICYIPILLSSTFIRDKQQLKVILVALSTSIAVASGYGIWQGIHGELRAAAFSSMPSIFATELQQMILLLIVIGMGTKEYSLPLKTFFWGGLILAVIALGFNGTRGVWVAITFTMMIYRFIFLKRNRKMFRYILMLIGILGLLMLCIPQMLERLHSITDLNYPANFERLLIWKGSWRIFLDHPLLGIGPDTFVTVYSQWYISPLNIERAYAHTHNVFLQYMVETGILGFCSFLYLFGQILHDSYVKYINKSYNTWFLATFLITISLLIQGLTDYLFQQPDNMWLYCFIIGLAYANSHINSKLDNAAEAIS